MASSTLKDADLLRLSASKQLFNLDSETRQRVLNAIKQDVAFLARHNLMDYSLFVGIEDTLSADESFRDTKLFESNFKKSEITNLFMTDQYTHADTSNYSVNRSSSIKITRESFSQYHATSACGRYVFHISIIDYL